MTNTKLFLLIGTSLSLIPQTINAQCVATQDCATLGYTESSCSGGSGVKCPFGNKWACFKTDAEYEQEFCSKYGFTQTCTGTNQTGGSGKACGGKYNACACTEGYEWKDGSCQVGAFFTGPQETAYYCKGNVVAVKTPEMDFYVGLYDLGEMMWGSAYDAAKNYIFCDNLKGSLPSYYNEIGWMLSNDLDDVLLKYGGYPVLSSEFYWTGTSCDGGYYSRSIYGKGCTPGNISHFVRPVLNIQKTTPKINYTK